MTILSYKTIFGPTFSGILENLLESFFRKNSDFGPKWPFFRTLGQIWAKWEFFQKKGSAIFLPLLSPNFMPSFEKILGAVSEINCVTDVQTHEQGWYYRTGRFAGSKRSFTENFISQKRFPKIFRFGMKLAKDGRARALFLKKVSLFANIWPEVLKKNLFATNHSFWGLVKNYY